MRDLSTAQTTHERMPPQDLPRGGGKEVSNFSDQSWTKRLHIFPAASNSLVMMQTCGRCVHVNTEPGLIPYRDLHFIP
jgi:hypothetical protein